METVLPFIGVGLLALACPLGMVGIGVVTWLIARARGQKRDLSMGCMPMVHGAQHSSGAGVIGESALREEVARLQGEVQAVKAQANTAANNG